jgi:hypothetical protein
MLREYRTSWILTSDDEDQAGFTKYYEVIGQFLNNLDVRHDAKSIKQILVC